MLGLIIGSYTDLITASEITLLKDLAALLEDEFEAHANSTTDKLTGLSNRHGFEAIGHHAIAMCKRMDKAATLMYLKLTNFAEINDRNGRDSGDRVLTDIGQLLLNEFRNSDVIARTGSDEFSVLLTGTTTESMAKPLKNLTAALHEENMNLPFDLTYEVRVVAFEPERHLTTQQMLDDACQTDTDD